MYVGPEKIRAEEDFRRSMANFHLYNIDIQGEPPTIQFNSIVYKLVKSESRNPFARLVWTYRESFPEGDRFEVWR